MRRWINNMICLAFCMAAGNVCSAQFLNKEIDFDETADFCADVFLLDSNQLFLLGSGIKFDTFARQLQWLRYSLPGNSVTGKAKLLTVNANYGGYFGKAKQTLDGSIVSSFTLVYYEETPQNRGFAGLIKINPYTSDTVFTRYYTDTSNNFEIVEEVTQLSDSSFVLGGERYYKTYIPPSTGLLYKTDKEGIKLWRKTIDAPPSDLGTLIQSIQYIGNNKLLIGACARDYQVSTGEYVARPYFALLDTSGNIMHSRFYANGYRGYGNIYKDKNGGYYHWGNLDSLIDASQPMSGLNHPGYVARLDDSFNFVWTYVIYDTVPSPYHSNVKNVLQLSDSNYLVMASHISNDVSGIEAKVMKISKEGNLIWQHRFHVDTGTYDCYLVDAVERPDKSLLLVGSAKNAFNPVPWNQDFWLVGLDSNGCITAGCSPTGVVQLPPKEVGEVQVYPNPTKGALTIDVPEEVRLSVVNMQGQQVAVYELHAGENQLKLPSSMAPGLYMGRLLLKNGKQTLVKIVYQP